MHRRGYTESTTALFMFLLLYVITEFVWFSLAYLRAMTHDISPTDISGLPYHFGVIYGKANEVVEHYESGSPSPTQDLLALLKGTNIMHQGGDPLPLNGGVALLPQGDNPLLPRRGYPLHSL